MGNSGYRLNKGYVDPSLKFETRFHNLLPGKDPLITFDGVYSGSDVL